ncbi:MAG TPA: hypothetical protein VG013_39505 [Gemmataceae bacterium]|jgi:hypothetical protein|nr:hypothetical protein [Gemmataceae bacterium]
MKDELAAITGSEPPTAGRFVLYPSSFILRKWLVRGLVFSVLGGLGAAGFLYQRWTNPAAVRQQVLNQLARHFPGAAVTLDGAYLRLLGGIAVKELRLCRRDDPARAEVAYFPSGTIYHDKEQLVNGQLAVRKLELHRPRLRLSRGRDGRWNVAGILGPVNPRETIPTIVVQGGTILLEDRLTDPTAPAVQIDDVNLTIVNDPRPTVHFEGTGHSALLGSLRIAGTWQRESLETVVSVRAGNIAVGPALIQRLAPHAAGLAEHGRYLEGTCDLDAEFSYHPEAVPPWTHDVRWHLTGGKFRHPKLPLPLEQLEATVRCLDGQVTVEKLTAQAGGARVEVKRGRVQALTADADLEGTLEVTHLALDSRLFDRRVPANLQKIKDDYAPAGAVSLTLDLARRAGQWSQRCVVRPEDMTAAFRGFPYALEHLTGRLEQEIDPARQIDLLKVDLVGYAGPRRVYIQGSVAGDGPAATVDLRVWGSDITLDHKLCAALPPVYQELARSFHPTGLADFEAHIVRTPGVPECSNHYVIHFHDATVRYDIFPYPLEGVSGELDIQPTHWAFSKFRGRHKGGEVHCHGGNLPAPRRDCLRVEVSGHDILLDPELAAALEPQLKQAWQLLTPSGRIHFLAAVEHAPDRPADADVTLKAAGCAIRPAFFPFDLRHMTGTIHYANHCVHLDQLAATHGRTSLSLGSADVYLKPAGGVWAKLVDLRGSPLMPDRDFVVALPPLLRGVMGSLRLKDPVALTTQLTIDTSPGDVEPPIIFWDGEIGLRDATVYAGVPWGHLTGTAACHGRCRGCQLEGLVGHLRFDEAVLFKQPFRDMDTQIEVAKDKPDVLQMPNVKAHLFGGDVGGEARLDFGRTLRYELSLAASRVRLEEFGRQNLDAGTRLSGLAAAQLYLAGEGADAKGLTGRGTIDIGPNGRLYNLPLLLDLLKVLGLRRPDGTAFEEAHAEFSIRGPRVLVSHVDLLGNSFSLRGQGEMNLDGSDISLDFYAIWALAVQMLPPVIKEIPEAFSRNLLKIKMRGRMGNVQCTKEPVPVLVDPVKGLLERIAGRRDGQPAEFDKRP